MEMPEAESSHPAPAPQEPAPHAAHFEFGERESAHFAHLAARMHFVGLFTLAVGIFVIVLGVIVERADAILSGALYAVFGIWTHRASVSFRSIAETEGKDIAHLMAAIYDLKRLYTVQFWLCVLSLVISLVVAALLIWRWKG